MFDAIDQKMSPSFRAAIEALYVVMTQVVSATKPDATTQVSKLPYYRETGGDFEYTPDGYTWTGEFGELLEVPDWHELAKTVAKRVVASEEAKRCAEELALCLSHPTHTLEAVEAILRRAGYEELAAVAGDPQRLGHLFRSFILEATEGVVHSRGVAELGGVAVVLPALQLELGDARVTLRRVTPNDLQKPRLATPFTPEHVLRRRPGAIVEVSTVGKRSHQEVQERIEQVVALLRLFRVGGVVELYGEIESDSLALPCFGRAHPLAPRRPAESYIVRADDEDSLRCFIGNLSVALPRSFFFFPADLPEADHRVFAWQRYCDALFQDAVAERRIAHAVMGLEALLLKAEEHSGLAYTLAARAAKMVGVLGKDAFQVRKAVRLGYAIRSDFVHGSRIRPKAERTLRNQFGGIGRFTTLILDCLRLGIVAFCMSPAEKERVIDLIDNALLCAKAHRELEALVAAVVRT